tara:strand:- start:4536 stop:5072 length:537 start_codon:yes stop_codon:yes gene_type:complete
MNSIELFFIILSISCVTFGGGYQAIPIFKKYFVDSKLIDESEFLKIIKTELLIPGSVGINLAVLIGKSINGNTGLIISSIAWILPSIIICILFYKSLILTSNKYYNSFLKGIILCTIALIINTLSYLLTSSVDLNIINVLLIISIVMLLHYNVINSLFIIIFTGLLYIVIENYESFHF